jgi:hypothetical protein
VSLLAKILLGAVLATLLAVVGWVALVKHVVQSENRPARDEHEPDENRRPRGIG